jgi:hypothetical protein
MTNILLFIATLYIIGLAPASAYLGWVNGFELAMVRRMHGMEGKPYRHIVPNGTALFWQTLMYPAVLTTLLYVRLEQKYNGPYRPDKPSNLPRPNNTTNLRVQ